MKTNTQFALAYDFLRERILSGKIDPGSFLSAQGLAKEVGVSRSPVRDALRYLEREGLVNIVPRLGAVAASLSPKQAYDLIGLREALEVYAVGVAATLRSPAELEALEASLKKFQIICQTLIENPVDTEAIARAEAEDIHFHMLIIRASRNEMIQEKIENTQLLNRLISPHMGKLLEYDEEERRQSTKAVVQEHKKIFQAIQEGNAEAAKACMATHFQEAAKKLRHAVHHSQGGNFQKFLTSSIPQPA